MHQVLADFGAPLGEISVAELQSDDLVFAIGVPPLRIDILTDISGVTFAEAWETRVQGFFGDVPTNYIGRAELIVNKRATGRMKDLADIEALEAGR